DGIRDRTVTGVQTCALPILGGQLIRSGTSVGANYRAACRARSKLEFIAKIGIVEEEADESAFWMELIIEAGLLKPQLVESLLTRSEERRVGKECTYESGL